MTDPATERATDPVLETRGVTKRFGALTASDDVSLTLEPGEVHAVIGPNGAGKSTLIAQISGSLAPDAGSVHFLGADVTSLSTRERARAGLGRTFQVSALVMEDTVLQNVVLGAIGHASRPWRFLGAALADRSLRDRAEAALEAVGLIERRHEIAATVSHGQRRLLEVAVALTLEPRAFVMDEPMAGLGADGSRSLTSFLDGLREDAPILLVEHDMDAVFALADRVSVLVDGRVIASGSVTEIRGDAGVREAYLGGRGVSLLSVRGLRASYGLSQALFGVDLEIGEGEAVALMGRNGMGKSTTVKCLCRLLPSSADTLAFAGHDLSALPSHRAARLGIGLVPEGRRCFARLTVRENLIAAARPGPWTLASVGELFPRLGERAGQTAASLSGGEQQMLAIGRALMTNPRLLILDEATEGLAPTVRREIWSTLHRLKRESGLALLVIDKSVGELRGVCDGAVVLERGRTVWTGPIDELTPELTDRHVGV